MVSLCFEKLLLLAAAAQAGVAALPWLAVAIMGASVHSVLVADRRQGSDCLLGRGGRSSAPFIIRSSARRVPISLMSLA